MTKKYKQLTLKQTYKIKALLLSGKSQTEIAANLGIHRSIVCRELKRNCPQRCLGAKNYLAENSEANTLKRHKKKVKSIKLTLEIKLEMQHCIETLKYSP